MKLTRPSRNQNSIYLDATGHSTIAFDQPRPLGVLSKEVGPDSNWRDLVANAKWCHILSTAAQIPRWRVDCSDCTQLTMLPLNDWRHRKNALGNINIWLMHSAPGGRKNWNQADQPWLWVCWQAATIHNTIPSDLTLTMHWSTDQFF